MCDETLVGGLRGGLIVSLQARTANPLHGPVFAAALARAVVAGGARALRVDGPEDVRAVRAMVDVPILAIRTVHSERYPVSITPSFADAAALVAAGAQIVAIDATRRPRAGGEDAATLIRRIKDELDVPVEADVDLVEDALRAVESGADLIGSSVTGYLRHRESSPDIDLVRRLVAALDRPVVAERHYWAAEHIADAFAAGAHAVVVGSAIVDPAAITARLLRDAGISRATESR